ncbi:MAG: hypothetical protein WBL50_18490 [Candidatus Acidiferrum sp.]
MNRIKELPSSMNSPPMHIVPPLLITKKKITKAATNIPNKHWNTPTKHSIAHKKLIGSP